MSTKKKILIGVGIFIGLIAVVVVAVFMTTGKERDLATKFVGDISVGKTSEAYSQYSADLKEVQDQATFESQVATLELDSSCELQISGLESSTSTDYGNIKKISGSVKCDDKTVDDAYFVYNGDGELLEFSIK